MKTYTIKTQFAGGKWNFITDGHGGKALFDIGEAYKTAKQLASMFNVRVYKGTRIVWQF